MENNFLLLVGILLLQLVVHCSGSDLKVEDGAKTDLDPKVSLTSKNSNTSGDQTSTDSNAIDIKKVKEDRDQVGASKEGVGTAVDKSNPSKEVGLKQSHDVLKSGRGSSGGFKMEGYDKKQKPSDGLESKQLPKEVDNGGNVVTVNPVRKEGPGTEECDPVNRCTAEESKLVACLRVPGNDSPHLSLLIQNKGKGPLLVTIVAPDFVALEETKIQLEEKENKKVKVSVGNGGTGSSIVLKAGNGHCDLDLKDLITHSSRKEPENSSNLTYTNFLTQRPTIVIVFFATLLILAAAWMCISFRHRRLSSNGFKYQKLDDDLPVSNEEKPELHINDGWDNTWDDNWDDEEAPHTPSMPITPSLSGKGLASRRLNKEGWKD